jgi:hypothetical protein
LILQPRLNLTQCLYAEMSTWEVSRCVFHRLEVEAEC